MQSFLNLIDIQSGRQVRLAEFGFKAESPSFTDDKIIFVRDGEFWSFDEISGMIAKIQTCPPLSETSSDVKLNLTSESSCEVELCELIVNNKIIARFMGNKNSLGLSPERDGKVIFFGYPSPNGIN